MQPGQSRYPGTGDRRSLSQDRNAPGGRSQQGTTFQILLRLSKLRIIQQTNFNSVISSQPVGFNYFVK